MRYSSCRQELNGRKFDSSHFWLAAEVEDNYAQVSFFTELDPDTNTPTSAVGESPVVICCIKDAMPMINLSLSVSHGGLGELLERRPRVQVEFFTHFESATQTVCTLSCKW